MKNKKASIKFFGILLFCILIFSSIYLELVSAVLFNKGDIVEVYNAGGVGLTVRGPNACDSKTLSKADGSQGMILEGPTVCNGYTRWKIRWEDASEGWSAEGEPAGIKYLKKITISPSTKFSIGDKVKATITPLHVRTEPPNLVSNGTVSTGSQGTVIGGPFYGVLQGVSGFRNAWKINFGSIQGWSSENGLEKDIEVTLTLYVHDGNVSGQIISGARITGKDAAEKSFDLTTNSEGYVTITGAPGTWSFTASKTGYESVSWSKSTTASVRNDAFLIPSCTNECLSGQTICSGNYKQTCGNYDSGSCLEFGGDSDCGSSYCENFGGNYCKNGNVYHSRTCYSKGCSSNNCFNNPYTNEPLVQTCSNGCIDGNCVTEVTLTLYVHDGNVSGQIISGARITGKDAAEKSFDLTTNSEGYVTITGSPGTWSFTASKTGYESVSWSKSTTASVINDAFLMPVCINECSSLMLYVHDGRVSGPIISGARVYGSDASGKSFDLTTNSEGYEIIIGSPGTWQFTVSKIGYKTVSWSQTINTTCRRDAYVQKESPLGHIVITSPLEITPVKTQYDTSDILTAQFTIKNTGTSSVMLDVLAVGGRDPDNMVIDFYWERNVTISPNSEYTYVGNILSLFSKEGNYHFFCTYRTQEGDWNTNIDLGPGLTLSDREKDIAVVPKYYLSSVPLIDRGGVIIPSEIFPAANGEMIPIYVPSVIDGSNIIRDEDSWRTVKDDITRTYVGWPSWEEFLIGFMSGIGSADTHRQAVANSVIAFVNTAANTISVLKYKVAIQQKGSEDNFRAVIQQGEYPSPIEDLAGTGEQVIINPFDNIYFSNALKETFYLEPLSFPYSYWLTGSVDSLHRNDEHLYYLSVAKDNRIILTPKIYPDDKIEVKKISDFNPFNQETIIELKGEEYVGFFSGRVNDENSKAIKKVLSPIRLILNSTITIQEHSSGELRVYDSNGKVTGIVNGVIKEEIPLSMYDNETKTVSLFDPSSIYHYDIVGTTAGTYGLTITSIGKESTEQFNAANIPISNNAVYQYQVDWGALSQGESGVTVKIDSEGDGIFEQTILTGNNFQIAKTINLSLNAGWNLISLPIIPENNSIENVFANVMDKVIVINSFDNGALTYDPKLPMFSDLNSVDYLHGYWMKMNESAVLSVSGSVLENKTINLEKNWNLISYMCDEARNVSDVFSSIMDKVIVINGFENGALTYDPKLPEFSDLQEMKPDKGYWVKLNESAVLDYGVVC